MVHWRQKERESMDFFARMIALQAQLFILIFLGVLLARTGVIREEGRKCLSSLLIDLILPCNIMHSFMSGMGVTAGFIRNCLWAFLICAIIQFAAIFGSRILFRRFGREKKSVLSYGLICSNSSFIGLPVAEALYGSTGVMFTSVFQIPIRFTMWTAGLSLFTEVKRTDALKKLATHPCIVSIFIGLALMALPVQLPGFARETISSLSRCCIPVSMLVIGSILTGTEIYALFSGPVLYYCFLRLMAFPLVVYAVLSLLPMDPLLVNISVLMTGMPAGSTTSILADRYGCDSLFASQLVFASTLFSVITLPVLCLVL